jgi:hypothetical protein
MDKPRIRCGPWIDGAKWQVVIGPMSLTAARRMVMAWRDVSVVHKTGVMLDESKPDWAMFWVRVKNLAEAIDLVPTLSNSASRRA